jgi:hypothetical protein
VKTNNSYAGTKGSSDYRWWQKEYCSFGERADYDLDFTKAFKPNKLT